MKDDALGIDRIRKLANFRYQLRRFERFSEVLTRQHGVTQLQYLLMLQIKGFPGRSWATIVELSERLQAHHHGVISLIKRCESLGMVTRTPGVDDRRTVQVRLTPKGDELVIKLARLHRDELLALQAVINVTDQDV